ncbi:peptide synthase [Nocardioides sp. KC13]|uniref:Peptide synthase n=1 Tax=Nocardioides turkmenicus TaxID=2711220 RepID=A0A6M1R0N3_9ACTN|nr:condensation domain-containing protein [Nocardioides sp. KC13]NGN93252.1 peptide synthase [Nocardioides sp. KC13]
MLVTTADLWEPRPGTLLRWDVSAPAHGAPAELSLNQRNHLAGAMAGAPTVWLAAAFDVDGPVEPVALSRTWRAFLARHGSLQFEVAVGADGPQARRHHPGTLTWSVTTVCHTSTVEETRAVLHAALDERCVPFGYPAFLPAAVSRPDRSTIVLGMDHLHCDAHSVAVAVEELAELYAAFADRGEESALPAVVSFLDAVSQGTDGPARVAADDPLLRGWGEFLAGRGHRLPTFPLPLGLEPGERADQATAVASLADADLMDRVSARARNSGASTYAAVLAALATAISDLGGGERLDTMAPVSTRSAEQLTRSIGWYTTTVPLTVPASLTDLGLAEAGDAVRHGVRLGSVPLDQVLGSLTEPLVQTRSDVFVVSWVDYRHLPGGSSHLDRDAHHISASTEADDVQIWFSRTHTGLAVRVRYPDTEIASKSVSQLLDRLEHALADLATSAESARTDEMHRRVGSS